MIDKINFLDPLLEWTNRHYGSVELVEYFPFDHLHVAFGVWNKKKYRLFKLLDGRAHIQDHATVLALQYPFPKPKPVPSHPLRCHPPDRKNREDRGGGREEKRREIRARLRRSSSFLSKNWLGFLSSFRFPHLHGLFSLFMVVPPCVV